MRSCLWSRYNQIKPKPSLIFRWDKVNYYGPFWAIDCDVASFWKITERCLLSIGLTPFEVFQTIVDWASQSKRTLRLRSNCQGLFVSFQQVRLVPKWIHIQKKDPQRRKALVVKLKIEYPACLRCWDWDVFQMVWKFPLSESFSLDFDSQQAQVWEILFSQYRILWSDCETFRDPTSRLPGGCQNKL